MYILLLSRKSELEECYQTGHVTAGIMSFGESGDCPNRPSFDTWYNLTIHVTGRTNTTEVYLNDDVITNSLTFSRPVVPSGGIVGVNGYENVMRFKNFKLYITPL